MCIVRERDRCGSHLSAPVYSDDDDRVENDNDGAWNILAIIAAGYLSPFQYVYFYWYFWSI